MLLSLGQACDVLIGIIILSFYSRVAQNVSKAFITRGAETLSRACYGETHFAVFAEITHTFCMFPVIHYVKLHKNYAP